MTGGTARQATIDCTACTLVTMLHEIEYFISNQLKPIFEVNHDVIAYMESGFITTGTVESFI